MIPMTASLALTMPELILSLGGMALLMVAAFGGDGLARAIGWGATFSRGGRRKGCGWTANTPGSVTGSG